VPLKIGRGEVIDPGPVPEAPGKRQIRIEDIQSEARGEIALTLACLLIPLDESRDDGANSHLSSFISLQKNGGLSRSSTALQIPA
jgi:hypothetical protein